MEILVVIALGCAVLAGFLYVSERKNKLMLTEAAAAAQRGEAAARQEIALLKGQISEVEKRVDEKASQARQLKEEMQAVKQKLHDKKKSQEQASRQLQELKEKSQSQASVEEMREQMLAALTENANLRRELQATRSASSKASPTFEASAEQPALVVSNPEVSDGGGRSRRRIEQLERQVERRAAFVDELEKRVASERSKFAQEVKDLRKRLSRALQDVDKERRRAENIDKAYRMLKSQLDSMLDRLARVEGARRPGQVDPSEERAATSAAPALASVEEQVAEATAALSAAQALSESLPAREGDALADAPEAAGVASDSPADDPTTLAEEPTAASAVAAVVEAADDDEDWDLA
mgnify:CR=1 FL=1